MTPLWSSWWDGRSRAALRIGVALLAGIEFLVQVVHLSRMAGDGTHFASDGPMHRLLAHAPWLPWAALVAMALGLVAVAVDRHPVLGGAWALGWMSLVSFAQTELFGSPLRNAFFPGVALLGWVLGQAWAREALGPGLDGAAGRGRRERYAEAGALAGVAAAYVGSATSKLLASGFSWGGGLTVRALVLSQHPLANWQWLHAYRSLLIEHGSFAAAASTATLIIEGGAFLLLFGARLRLAWAALIVGLHANIILLCTMPYVEPMLLLALFALPWPRWVGAGAVAAPPPDGDDAPRVPWSMAWVLGGLVALGWVLAPLGWNA